MERLTKHGGSYCDTCGTSPDEFCSCEEEIAMYNKLAAYEDSGLEPEDVYAAACDATSISPVCVLCRGKDAEGRRTDYCNYEYGELDECMEQAKTLTALATAKKEGRLVALPFAVGTDVWSADPFKDGKPRQGRVPVFEADEDGAYAFWVSFSPEPLSAEFLLSDVGKTVFLAREEAEKALEGMG